VTDRKSFDKLKAQMPEMLLRLEAKTATDAVALQLHTKNFGFRKSDWGDSRDLSERGSPLAARDEDGLAGDPARILGGKKHCDGTDVVGLANAAQRGL
jgi:hypothetical protein